MKLKQLDDSQAILYTNHGHEILYSDGKAVAGYIPVIGYFKAAGPHSVKRQAHINNYLHEQKYPVTLTEDTIENLFKE
jgi:hypothetical protein